MPTVTVPHNYSPRQYQLPLLKALDSGIKRAVWVAHRRSGKDKTLLNLTIKKMLERVGAYYYFFPTYTQAKKVIWNGADKDGFPFLGHFPKELIENKNDTEMTIKLKNGSLFQLIGTDKIDSIVGTNPIGAVFSEYSLQNPKAWEFIRPILAENGGWAVFNFTPRGKNHGFKILQQAKQEKNWWWEVLTVNDTNSIDREVLEQEKREMPLALYNQEYMCEFLDGAGQFFRNIKDNLWEPPSDIPKDDFKIGIDLAKYQDFSVITPFNLNTFKVYPQDRFNGVDWTTQEGRIEALYRRYGAQRATVDATGVGDPIVENLRARGLNIEDDDAFKFTETSRDNLLRNLAMMLEMGKIKIPNDEGLISELESFQLELTERGKVTIKVPESLHDDRVMSLALAVWGYNEPVRKTVNIEQVYEEEPLFSDIGL